jgi:hypothetical protein
MYSPIRPSRMNIAPNRKDTTETADAHPGTVRPPESFITTVYANSPNANRLVSAPMRIPIRRGITEKEVTPSSAKRSIFVRVMLKIRVHRNNRVSLRMSQSSEQRVLMETPTRSKASERAKPKARTAQPSGRRGSGAAVFVQALRR